MRFCDTLLRDTTLSATEKQLIASSQVIVADNVAEYYFRGTDQEYWSIATDFPNVAPPFEQCFIECRAPQQIVSQLYGTRPWPAEMARAWGVLCLGTDVTRRREALESAAGRALLLQEAMNEVRELWRTVQTFVPGVTPETLEERARHAHLTPDQRLMVEQTLVRLHRSRLMQAGQWAEVAEQFSRDPHRWILDLIPYAQLSEHGKDVVWGPLWLTRLYITAEGNVVTTAQGAALVEDKPLGDFATTLTTLRLRRDARYEEILMQMRSSVLPFVHVALLTISFLHCQNVQLQTVIPPKKPLSHKQKRRGDPPFARLTYHVLDIAPMRQVLRTHGHEERNGTKQALHICRGHFADYREGRGLFGKYKGVYWRPQHLRGSLQQGTTSKDYHITL